ncbi:MAG: hypothetical protein MHMPM18_000574 [Marteilia pararefringens]
MHTNEPQGVVYKQDQLELVLIKFSASNRMTPTDDYPPQSMETDDDAFLAALELPGPTDDSLIDENGSVIGCRNSKQDHTQTTSTHPTRPAPVNCRNAAKGCLKRFSAPTYERLHADACKFDAGARKHQKKHCEDLKNPSKHVKSYKYKKECACFHSNKNAKKNI